MQVSGSQPGNGFCARCGAELNSYAPEGQCPQCMLRAALGGAPPPIALSIGPAQSPSPLPSSAFPIRFGEYELLEEIAHGGMGIVYRSRQISLDRIVAVKRLLFGALASPEYVQRFRAEAAAAASLQHPNIVAIHEVGFCDGQHFFAMDHVAGRSLAEIVREGPLPARRAAGYVKTIAEAIQHAHERNILHRDLKPSNVLIDTFDQPRVTDFGLAKRLEKDSDLTLSGQVLGSPNYMPPEQCDAKWGNVGRRSDVYALGAMLYHLVSGRPPFVAGTIAETLHQVQNEEPVSPQLLNPSVPRDLATICLKCLEKAPAKRYATAQLLAEELGRYLRDEPIMARPARAPEKFWRWCRRKPVIASLAAGLVLVAALGAFGVLRQWRKAAQSAEQNHDQLVRLHVANGNRLLQEGDSFAAAAWFADALALDQDRPAREVVHRLRLESLLKQSPKLLQMWFLAAGIDSAEFSPDGGRVLAASPEGAQLWDVERGRALTPLLRHAGEVNHACFSPDGQRVLTAGMDNARVWNATNGQREFILDHDRLRDAIFSPDGKRIATASSQGTVRIWDAATGESLAVLRHASHVAMYQNRSHLMFSPDSQRLLTANYDATAKVWNVKTGSLLLTLEHSHAVRHAEFSPDGKIIATANWGGTAHLWSAATGEPRAPPLPHQGMVDHVTFSPDGILMASSSQDGSVRLWNATNGAPIRTLSEGKELILESRFSRDGSLLVGRRLDGRVLVWSLPESKLACPPLRHSRWATSARFHPDGRRLLTACADGSVRLWDLMPDSSRLWPWGQEDVAIINWSRDGARVVTQNASNLLRVCQAGAWASNLVAAPFTNVLIGAQFGGTKERLLTLELNNSGAEPSASQVELKALDWMSGRVLHHASVAVPIAVPLPKVFAASPDCTQATLGMDRMAEAWDLVQKKQLWRSGPHATRVEIIRYSPDAGLVALNCGRVLHVLEAATGNAAYPALTNHLAVSSADFSPDGRLLVTTGCDSSYVNGEACVWEASTGKLMAALTHHDGANCAAFSHDSRRLATGGEAAFARIFDLRTGRALTPDMPHQGTIRCVAFSPDDRLLATGSEDNTARVWDSATGEAITAPLPHPDHVTEVSFLGRGEYLVTRSAGRLRLWQLTPQPRPREHLVAVARLTAGHHLDATGVLEPLNLPRLSNAWNQVRAAFPEDFGFLARKRSPLLGTSFAQALPPPRIPERDSNAPPSLLDLTPFFNKALTDNLGSGVPGNDLATLPRGQQRLAGTEFDIRGVIQLSGRELEKRGVARFPRAITNMPANLRFERLHCLHGAGWPETKGARIGAFVLHFADGQQLELPIVYGEDVLDWWGSPSSRSVETMKVVVAWTGRNAAASASNRSLRLFKRTWLNPRPGVEVTSIDFVSAMTKTSPFLIAITVE